MSGNYSQIIDQIEALERFAGDAFEAGRNDRDIKKEIRNYIFYFRERHRANQQSIENEDDEAEIPKTLSHELDASRSALDDYVDEYCQPSKIPEVFFTLLDDYAFMIKVIDANPDAGLKEDLDLFCDEWSREASRIMRRGHLPSRSKVQVGMKLSRYQKKDEDDADHFKR